jgi:RNA polymerase sigma-70 factor, ECF subfamily
LSKLEKCTNMVEVTFKQHLIQSMPALRAFAISLSGHRDRADDLVQETLMKAWGNQDKFVEGSNIKAWLFTILRNEYYNYFRKRRKEVEDGDGKHAATLATLPAQESGLNMSDMLTALQQLPDDQREALLLVTASDMTYEEAAQISGVAVGTVKSRVNRAREKLVAIMELHHPSEFGPSAELQAAMVAKPD